MSINFQGNVWQLVGRINNHICGVQGFNFACLLVCLFFFLGKDTHPFSASHHQYTLEFKRWCQKNNKYKTERPVRRRPAEFVSKHNIADIVSQRWLYYNFAMFESTRWGGEVYFSRAKLQRYDRGYHSEVITLQCCDVWKHSVGGGTFKMQDFKIWQRDYHSEVIILQCCDVWKHMVGDGDTLRYNKGK